MDVDIRHDYPFNFDRLDSSSSSFHVDIDESSAPLPGDVTHTNGITFVTAGPPSLDEAAQGVGTGFKQVWGSMTLWGNGHISEQLVRNNIKRSETATKSFEQACVAHSIDCSDLRQHTELYFALAYHCLEQLPSPAVADTFTEIMRDRGLPMKIHGVCRAKVNIWRERIGQPILPLLPIMGVHPQSPPLE